MKRQLVAKNVDSFSLKARVKSFQYAFEGIIQFFKAEHNAVIHLFITMLVCVGVFAFHLSRPEVIAVIFAIGFVWTSELFNTAVENFADMISEEFNPKIKFIKDVSAAAVLISACSAAAVGLIVFLPKILP
jgi:diacylglycerol kinase (ATP)